VHLVGFHYEEQDTHFFFDCPIKSRFLHMFDPFGVHSNFEPGDENIWYIRALVIQPSVIPHAMSSQCYIALLTFILQQLYFIGNQLST
jgi:hypothetical protein